MPPNPSKIAVLAAKFNKPAIDPAIKALKKLNPAELELAISRLESLPTKLDISRYSPAALARISALQPAAQRGFSESLISTRPPFAASLMKPSEFLSRTEPLTAARDPEVIARLKASIGDKKLQELPALWVNQKPGGLDAAYEGRHRMQALLEMYGDDPVMMSLIKGDRFEPRVDFFGKPYEGAIDEMRLSPEEILRQKIQMGDRPLEIDPLWTGYADGGKVKNPDQMTHKPQAKTANPLQALARGWAAGTAGLPGDIEGLARLAAKYVSAPGSYAEQWGQGDSALPTTDFYREWLPGQQEGIGSEVEGLGSLLGGVGSTLPAKGAVKVAKVAARNAAVPRTLSTQAGVIKMPGGNWLKGSVEDSLKGLKNPYVDKYNDAVKQWGPKADQWVSNPGDSELALNNWIDKQLTRYVKNDMATPGDPIRALAERGIAFSDYGRYPPKQQHLANRKTAGTEALAESPLAKQWEDATDATILPSTAQKRMQNWATAEAPRPEIQQAFKVKALGTDPWLDKIPPNTPVYQAETSTSTAADFHHLIDELRNATDPASGLPPELLLKYSSLPQVSVPQAVERVAKINAWREAKALEAKKARAEGIPVMKEYPGGYKWLSVPDVGTDDKALQYAIDAGCEGGWCTQGPETAKRYGAGEGGRLHILQGPDGSAHVQIHTMPAHRDQYQIMWDSLAGDPLLQGEITASAYGSQPLANPRSVISGPEHDKHAAIIRAELQKRYPDLAQAPVPQQITQIKGKSNRSPNAEYLPYVQDFVKSGQWSDVGDLQNTGLRRTSDAFNNLELQKIRDAGVELGPYHTPDEIKDIGARVWPLPPEYAKGGLVNAKQPGYNAVNPRAKQNASCKCQ